MKKLQLILTNPCLKDWDEMQPKGEGRYCDSCEKHVVDLSDKTDGELIQFFSRKKDNVCGRLQSSQLNRELIKPSSRASWQWLMPLAIGAVMATPAQANEFRPVIVQGDQALVPRADTLSIATNSNPSTVAILGTVKDSQTGKALQGVKLRHKGFENVLAITDSTGNFRISLPKQNLEAKFTFELDNYRTIETNLKDGSVIYLTKSGTIMLGGVSAISADQEPLLVVYAGKKSHCMDSAKLKQISPEWVEKLDVFKGTEAKEKYGAKAANGVIVVHFKKAYAKKINLLKKK